MANHLGSLPLLIAGSDDQKKKYLGRLTSEFSFCSYACSEPEAGSDVAGMQTRLTRDGDRWILNGQKRWITNAGHASFYTGFGTMDPALRHKGITAFVIPRDLPRVSTGKKENKLGQRASDTCDVLFDNVELGRSTSSVRRATASRSRWRLRQVASDDRRTVRGADPAAARRSRAATRSSARRSACRSRSTRPCSS